MPKNLFQEIVFTVLMVFVMVYAMICYNIALNMGGMSNAVFLKAFHELVIMAPIPFHLVLAISVISVIFMCPLMSLTATLLFKDAGREVIAVWLETTAMNFPMALCWQLFFAGPIVRFVFGLIFREREQKSGAVSAAAE